MKNHNLYTGIPPDPPQSTISSTRSGNRRTRSIATSSSRSQVSNATSSTKTRKDHALANLIDKQRQARREWNSMDQSMDDCTYSVAPSSSSRMSSASSFAHSSVSSRGRSAPKGVGTKNRSDASPSSIRHRTPWK